MSETDDTDILLLIPPDFFVVRTSSSEESLLESSRTVVQKPVSCTARVIGKLVNQVHSLENRLDSLEISTSENVSSVSTVPSRSYWDTDSLDSRSLDRKCFTFPRRRRRKHKTKRANDLSLNSLDSITKSEKIPSLKLNFEVASIDSKCSEINQSSMDGDISSIVSTPNKKNDKLLLNEIDEFLTKVDAYESPESKYKEPEESSYSHENVIKAAGDYIAHKLGSGNMDEQVRLPSGRTVSSTVLDKYIYLVRNQSAASQIDQSTPSSSRYKNQSANDTSKHSSDSRPNLEPHKNTSEKSPSVRKLNFVDNKDVQTTSTPKKPSQTTNNYMESFRPSTNKIYDRATKVLEQYKSQNYSRNGQASVSDNYMISPKKEEFKMPQMRPYGYENKDAVRFALQNKLLDTVDTDLLSLSELWGEKRDGVGVDRDSNKLEEERLKREHCEALIQDLQKKMLEQQEKIAVALRVDRAKDAAISKLKDAWVKLTNSLDRAEDRHRLGLEKMVREVDNFKTVAGEAQKKAGHYETELYKALDLAHDFQEKCKQLTEEKNNIQQNTEKALAQKDEAIASKEREIEILKENYETVMRLNKQSTDCVKNLEDSLEKEKSEHNHTKGKITDLNHMMQTVQEEACLISQDRDLMKEKVNEERARCNMLERQLCEKQNFSSELLKKCDSLDTEVKNLRKHLELQKNELKVHYQKQLEDAVLCKLQEFQAQLDQAERDMEKEAGAKEHAIVDGFNKQIALIQEQHKLEVNVLEEKQKEEIKLYRLQLVQASEKISLLESKLESYRRRRGAVAAQLHAVMQAQWRQALHILTQPTQHHELAQLTAQVSQDNLVPKLPKLEPLTIPQLDKLTRADSNDCKTSDTSNNLHFDNLSDSELQQYVKLLLSKPSSFNSSNESAPIEKCREISEEPTSDRPATEDKKDKRRSIHKPPWKA